MENIAELIYGKSAGTQLIRCYEDLYNINATPTLIRLQSSFVPAFLEGLVFGYPKYKEYISEIGDGKKYRDLSEFFACEVVDNNILNMGLDVTKIVVLNFKHIQETLKDHPKISQIMTSIIKLGLDIEYTVTPASHDDRKQSNAAILAQLANTIQVGAVANAATAATNSVSTTPSPTTNPPPTANNPMALASKTYL